MFRIFSEFLVFFRIFKHFSEYLAQKLVYSESLDFVVIDATYQISVPLGKRFRGEDFLEINQSKTRMACHLN
jgi:hypothetical protein